MNPLDLASASPWKRVLFTTYALSLSFFEAVLLDRLVRGGTKQALILADPDGVRSALSEQGARRAGRDYRLEPVAPTAGYFHPKVSVFEGEDDCHLLVGSGNLTFGGWGHNLEVIEHLHPSFAADAFEDAAEFFGLLSIDDTIRMEARESCSDQAERLARLDKGPRNGDIRLLHSIGAGIGADIVKFADELGGATRVAVVSPYFDRNGAGIGQLASSLGCGEIFVHSHSAGTVAGKIGTNWPTGCPVAIRPVHVETELGGDSRLLHAKSFEVLCRRGRLVIAGSANASGAALQVGRNVECSVLRMERETVIGWRLMPATAPSEMFGGDGLEEGEAEKQLGVLRAELNGDLIEGRVMRPHLTGPADASVTTQSRLVSLGEVEIDAAGHFKIASPGLEMDSWSAGRLVLRLEQRQRAAVGFLSLSIAFELTKRAGAMGPRIVALLSGSETPEDVAAVFAWFVEDPTRLPAPAAVPGAGMRGQVEKPNSVSVSVADISGPIATIGSASSSGGRESERAWERLYDMLRRAFRAAREPLAIQDEDDDDDEIARAKRIATGSKSTAQIVRTFPRLLDAILDPKNNGRHTLMALDMANYLCTRFDVGAVTAAVWLQRCLNALPATTEPSDQPLAVAAVLLYFGSNGGTERAEDARRYLIRHGLLAIAPHADATILSGFVRQMQNEFDVEAFRYSTVQCLTPGEDVVRFRRALTEASSSNFEGLRCRPQWSALERALKDPSKAARLIFVASAVKSCPECGTSLPTAEYSDLRRFGVATAVNCCGRVVLCEEA